MSYWFRGKKGALIAFLVILILVAGGMGWITAAALRLEHEQLEARLRAEQEDQLRLALWRLDGLVSPVLAREDSRPYEQYSAIHAPAVALQSSGKPWPAGAVLEPSPLLSAELPDWMLLHFQVDAQSGWTSPQVLSPTLAQRLQRVPLPAALRNVTPERRQLLARLQQQLGADHLLALVGSGGARPGQREVALVPGNNDIPNNRLNDAPGLDSEYANRASVQSQVRQQSLAMPQRSDPGVALENSQANGENWISGNTVRGLRGKEVTVTLGPMSPFWLTLGDPGEQLVLARRVQIGSREICQGILLDWPGLREVLGQQVRSEFPKTDFRPVHEPKPPHPERTMTALPVEFDPGLVGAATPPAGLTPLRIGLILAWAAALIALGAVGLGGWSLLDLSERRIRFVSAVTHELRTPLTTLRLYLDMLATGMVPAEKQAEYLQTLNAEADRLHRLIGNVLDFSRLENHRPRINPARVMLNDLMKQVHANWQVSCQAAGKELIIDDAMHVGQDSHPVGEGATEPESCSSPLQFLTDPQMLQQILGNLIENACKYSRGAQDRRIWLRARLEGRQWLVFEVEDRGPGVPSSDLRAIFRPFRRGQGVDATAGGVGLGLALAQRWAQSLGGKLTLRPVKGASGACFRFELPL
jgi:signal transduction histidine kinase